MTFTDFWLGVSVTAITRSKPQSAKPWRNTSVAASVTRPSPQYSGSMP